MQCTLAAMAVQLEIQRGAHGQRWSLEQRGTAIVKEFIASMLHFEPQARGAVVTVDAGCAASSRHKRQVEEID
jgi:hypothetical protein